MAPGSDPIDETTLELRAYLKRVPEAKVHQYRPEWTGDEVMVWSGDFDEDGFLVLPAAAGSVDARSIDVVEFRRELEAALAQRARERLAEAVASR
ncbi:MAG: hypothetical protein R2729_29600 [Bryobacteraceae bacterium]